jgi:tetratricopeptide (TPR) repeat protein
LATILQNRHDFTAALDLLKTALAINPRHLQAWLTKAAIHEAQGDYPSALRSCLGLAKLSASLSAAVCLNSALSLSGQAQYGYDQLRLVLAGNEANPEQLTWAYTILAEIAERLDKPKDAEDWYRKALSTGYRSVYLLTAYADFLLAHERPLEVQKLLHNESSIDALLLRLTLAEQRLQHPDYQMHVEIIKTRMAAAKARGDNVHQGDEARFALHVLKDAETALILARANWSVQKEPRDARLLLETAVAANAPDAAKSVLEFIAQSRLEDERLQGLVGLAKGDLL